ncbi:MAG: hypothetical protein PHI81_08065 [Synergistaceae bacterium]|jgi:hypothetical protein|uniref:hypothetical protein n=1 Tax=Aminivibrio sp. TaxID=1872489 RepID=UPI001D927EFC|nr:hypothetical protein [Synergistaceae bacterium]NCC57442.1 hypothetical protein [Synergistales bacterium]MDD3390961.1 hypothetical protein [Synergistaceae bacterium]MDD3689973.1 hypothetical protein [Synergistaceae bacterium]MDD4021107.1 hypothetical protein [Synergistaceae bacterium]
MKKIKSRWLALLAALMITLGGSAWAFNLGDLIGVIGGGFVVSAIAGPINDFINTITLNRGAKVEGHTKVVPIVSIGSGTHIGAAQVAGPRGDAITSTKAVAQIEATFMDRLRVKILVPIDSENPVQRFRRVQGVGVSAIIDVKL